MTHIPAASASPELISIRGLWHERGDRELFAGLDATLSPGELVQVLGPNGHGKTTLLRILAGFMPPDRGQLQWRGEHFAHRFDVSPAPIAYLGERPGWAPEQTVADNWRYLRALRGLANDAGLILDDPNWMERRFGDLSTGQRQRVALAGVLASQSPLWLLDEPLSGLDREASDTWCQRMRLAADQGGCVVVVSHEPLGEIVSRTIAWEATCSVA